MAEYCFTYLSVAESEETMLDDLHAILKKHEIEKTLVQRLMLAASEAFTNVMVHGNKRNPKKSISVKVVINDSEIRADISDEGHGALDKITRRTKPVPMSEGGRGVDLIEHYADQSEFHERRDGGLTVRLLFERRVETKMIND